MMSQKTRTEIFTQTFQRRKDLFPIAVSDVHRAIDHAFLEGAKEERERIKLFIKETMKLTKVKGLDKSFKEGMEVVLGEIENQILRSSERGSVEVKDASKDLELKRLEQIHRRERDAVKEISVSPDTTPAKRLLVWCKTCGGERSKKGDKHNA